MRKQEGKKRRKGRAEEEARASWKPLTKLGALVQSGEIKSIEEALWSRHPLKEHQIVETLLPDLSDEVLDINMVQRMTDSGRRIKFRVCVIVGNRDGYLGIGLGKDALVRNAITKAVRAAELNLAYIQRGCGSWECDCNGNHSLPFKVLGKAGGVEMTLKPAPKGLGLAAGETPKKVLEFAGVKDVWTKTKGKTQTTFNLALATYDALRKTAMMKTFS
ncbi:30S ribosomal protein S5 [ANME-1 cluster archaeon ex4572_4]|nr:30S ribosomal protein S5 [Methanophagales archaeon]OYT67209.1 MAG: 30S ribosomal protein S5 [ANME-1 cluster archaeon ex4572_4]PXF51737.1 MAG: 30S ribosomal protein S5 [Methanophagales archaeon]HDN68103.1 30S ribosomal protein S5 [Methanomicrobia archaeon]